MRKNLLSKIMLLLACMLVGGSAWAEKITDYANIVSGKTYYIGATVSGTDYYFYADDSSIATGVQGTSKTDVSEAAQLVFEGSDASWTIKFKESGYYLSLASSKANGKVNVQEESATWTLSNSNDLIHMAINNYCLQKNSSTSLNFGSYSSGQKDIWLEEVQEVSPLASIELSGNYPITFGEGVTFNHDGLEVIATYENGTTKDVSSKALFTGYDMDTPGSQTVTVSYTEGDVTKTATYDITVNAVPTHTVTWSVNGTTTTAEYKEGAAIAFPENPADVNDKTFVGWTATAISGISDEAPEFITSATMAAEDMTFYAVFASKSTGMGEIVDVLDNSIFGQDFKGYGSWEGKTASSNAVYAGNSMTPPNDNENGTIIQLRTNNNNSGIVSTTSGGKLTKVVIQWNSSTNKARKLNIYGKNSAYTSAEDLYNSSKQGTLLGTIDINGTQVEINDDYEFVGIRSNDGALYLDNISITWESEGATTITGYCTTVAEDTRAEAGISFAEAAVTKEIVEAYEGQALTNPNNLTIAWTSSNEKVATVDAEGKVTVLAIGETTITAKFAGNDAYKSATVFYTLTIQDSREALELAFAEESVSVNINDKVAAPTLNGNANNEAITYTSSNEAIATVDAQTGEVTGVAKGKATITATIAATNQHLGGTATFTVNVIDPNLMEDVFVLDETRGWENATAYASDEGVYGSLIASKGTNTNEPKYYSNGTATRFYNGNTLTVASSIKGIKSVEFTVTQGSGVSANNAHYEKSESEFVWTVTEGMAVNTLVFNFTEQVRITKITVNYAEITAPAAVAISDALYATFASENTVSFSGTDITVYAAEYNSKTSLVKLNEVEDGIVPANTAVVLKAAEAKTATPALAIPTSVLSTDLKVSDGTFTGGENIFALANNATYGVGFYNVKNTVTIPAGKAYLEIAAEEAREFIGFESEATGIVAVRESLRQQGAYSLSGQRVAAPTKGLYIVNGKKMVIK